MEATTTTATTKQLSQADLSVLAKLGITEEMIKRDAVKTAAASTTKPAPKKKVPFAGQVGSAPPEYVLCLTHRCKLCKTSYHIYFNMVKQANETYLRGEKITDPSLIPQTVDKRELINTESCKSCRQHLETLSKEELINKVLWYAYAYRERSSISSETRLHCSKACLNEEKEIKEMEKKEEKIEALTASLSSSLSSSPLLEVDNEQC